MDSQKTLSPIRHMAHGMLLATRLFSLKAPLFEGMAARRAQRRESGRQLLEAVKKNDAGAVSALLAKKASVRVRDEFGQTALWWAAKNGSTEITQMLLKAGANVDSANDGGFTPLMMAATEGHMDVALLLLGKGADTDKCDTQHCWTASMWAGASNHPELMILLEALEYDALEMRGPGNRPLKRE